jgi:hypothetical protein
MPVNNFHFRTTKSPAVIGGNLPSGARENAVVGEQAVHKKTWAKWGSVIRYCQFIERTGSSQVIEKLPERSRDNPRQLGKG